MKIKLLVWGMLLCFTAISPYAANAQNEHCGTTDALKELYKKDPRLESAYHELVTNNLQRMKTRGGADSVICVIPVVFHIIHQYGNENISDAQIYDQMDILNRDYRKLNPDTSDVANGFDSLIADVGIEFRLATIDPYGNCTNGIEHIYSHETNNGDDYSKLNQWLRNKYLNIWVVKSMRPGVAGYAYYPPATTGAFYFADGIIILHNYVGSIGTSNVNNSRALTHEIGHYLGLPHTWGSTNDPGVACGDDGIDDTPETAGWQTCNLTSNDVCNPATPENVQNYMEYAYCSMMFTLDQAAFMKATLDDNVAGRSNLWSAANLAETGVDQPNPAACTPVPEYSVSYKYICQGDQVQFKDQSWRAPVDTYEWTFTGATPAISTQANPTVTFNDWGWQTVALTVTNAAGSETKSDVFGVYVTPGWADFVGPHAEGFETNTANWWIVDNPEGNAAKWQLTSAAAHTGSKSFVLNNHIPGNDQMAQNRLGGNVDALISPIYELDNTTGASLSFAYSCATGAFTTEDITEELKVYSSVNCGKTWTLRKTIKETDLTNAGGGYWNNFVPNSQLWTVVDIPLSGSVLQPRVRFKFEYTSSDNSNNIYIDDININGVLAVSDVSHDPFKMQVYPNPSHTGTGVTLSFEGVDENLSLAVLDISGRLMYEYQIQAHPGKQSLDLDNNLAAGTYTVRLSGSGYSGIKRFVVAE